MFTNVNHYDSITSVHKTKPNKSTERSGEVYNYNKLTGRIVEMYGSRKRFSEAINVSESKVSLVLNGKRFIRTDEVDKWVSALNISAVDIPKYFFTKPV